MVWGREGGCVGGLNDPFGGPKLSFGDFLESLFLMLEGSRPRGTDLFLNRPKRI